MIRGMEVQPLTGWRGKNLNVNLAKMPPEALLRADNVQILADGVIRTAPGYTRVAALGAGPVARIYDYQRDVDQKQFVVVQTGGQLVAMNADGSGQVTLSTGESANPYAWVRNAFILYGSDGTHKWRFIDAGNGGLTRQNWGIAPPLTAPAIAVGGAASLTLTFGRQYVYCYVGQYTDSLGITRTSVSAPSPISAYTGPVNNQLVALSSLAPSSDPQVTAIWIFATYDAAYQTSATFYFAGAIAANVTTWGDTLPDTALDDTRIAPFNTNQPPPACDKLLMFQNRLWALTPNYIQYSGYEEVLLGIPEECWDPRNTIPVPSGVRLPAGGVTINNGAAMLVGTAEAFMGVEGYDATTISAKDRVLSPGLAGKQAVAQTPTHTVWIGPDKRLWAWNGITSYMANIPATAIDFSAALELSQPGTLSVNEIDARYLAHAELRYFSFGQEHYLLVATNTDGTGHLNWIALYQIATENGMLAGLMPTDKLPAHAITATGVVQVGGVTYVFLGDANGNVYRWPDGFSDAGIATETVFSTAWLGGEGLREWLWADFEVDDATTFTHAQVSAAAVDKPDMAAPLLPLAAKPYPLPSAAGQDIVRVPLRLTRGASIGKYLRLEVTLPADGAQHFVQKIHVATRPIRSVL